MKLYSQRGRLLFYIARFRRACALHCFKVLQHSFCNIIATQANGWLLGSNQRAVRRWTFYTLSNPTAKIGALEGEHSKENNCSFNPEGKTTFCRDPGLKNSMSMNDIPFKATHEFITDIIINELWLWGKWATLKLKKLKSSRKNVLVLVFIRRNKEVIQLQFAEYCSLA